MLEHAPDQPVARVFDLVAVEVERAHPSESRPADLPIAVGHGEAAFVVHELAGQLDDLRVDHHPGPEVVVGVEYGDAPGDAHLIGRQAHARCRVHRLDHVPDQGLDRGVDLGDRLGLHAEHRISEGANRKYRHRG